MPERIVNLHPTIATHLQDKDWLYITREHVPRATRLLQAIVDEALRRDLAILPPPVLDPETIRVNHIRNKPNVVFDLEASGRRHGLTIIEISRPGAGQTEPSAGPSRHPLWQYRRTWIFTSTGRLEISCCGSYRDERWVKLDSKLGGLFDNIEQCNSELEAREKEQSERIADRQSRWEAAMARARERYVAAAKLDQIQEMAERWEATQTRRAFLAAARSQLLSDHRDESALILKKLEEADRQIDAVDPMKELSKLAIEVPEPKPEDLRPFLGGWSPHGPGGR